MPLPKKDAGRPERLTLENPDLAALGAAAAAVDADTAYTDIPPEVDQVEQGTNYALEAQGMVDMVGALACGFCAEAAPLWQPAIKANMAASIAPVLEKYGFTMGGMPVEIAAILTCGPVLWQTARLIGDKIRRDRAAAQQPHAAPTAQAARGDVPQKDAEAPQATMPQMDLYKDGAGNTIPSYPDM
jgi:hypothetical protein